MAGRPDAETWAARVSARKAAVGGRIPAPRILDTLSRGADAAPHLMPVEVTAVLRRSVLSRSLADEVASLAHVALAEELDVPLATLDARLRRTSGPCCSFLTP